MPPISRTLEDYLEAIHILELENDVARVKDLSAMLDVKPPTAISAVRRLVGEKLAQHEHYGYIRLTGKGRKIAKQVYRRHKTLLRFLVKILGIPQEKAISQACGMEHSISRETRDVLEKFLDFLEHHPGIFKKWQSERG